MQEYICIFCIDFLFFTIRFITTTCQLLTIIFHHEKLDGTGYPFGKTADELNRQERIMACIDIYQALTESRPYKSGMTHEAACEILENMVQKGWIDGEITEQIKKCFA